MASSPAVIIDNGSFSLKAGFGDDRNPRVIIPSAISGQGVGSEAVGKPDVEYPIVRGTVKNWEGMEKVIMPMKLIILHITFIILALGCHFFSSQDHSHQAAHSID